MKINCFFKQDFQDSIYGVLAHPFVVGARNINICCSATKRDEILNNSSISMGRKIVHLVVGIALLTPILNTIILLVARLFKDSFQNKTEKTNDLQQVALPLKDSVSNQSIVTQKVKESITIGVTKLRDGRMISIKESEGKYKSIIFKAYDGSEELGYIEIDWFRWKNDKYVSAAFPNGVCFGNPARYGPNTLYYELNNQTENLTGMVNKIHVENLRSHDQNKGKGVGSALMQAAAEYGYQRGCKGRIYLEADLSSHVFYYGLGMRLQNGDRKLEARISKAYEENKKNGSVQETSFGHYVMYMPQEGIRKMGERIKQKPILFTTKAAKVALISKQRSNSIVSIPLKVQNRRKSI